MRTRPGAQAAAAVEAVTTDPRTRSVLLQAAAWLLPADGPPAAPAAPVVLVHGVCAAPRLLRRTEHGRAQGCLARASRT
jgi:hypothetical protein